MAYDVYALIKFPKKKKAKDAWKDCLSCCIYQEHPFFKKVLAIASLVIAISIAIIVGLSLSDKYTILFGVILGIWAYFATYFTIFDKLPIKKDALKVICSLPLPLLGVLLSQYIRWGLIFMLMIWGSTIFYTYKHIQTKRINKLLLWCIPVFITPILCMGYNVFSMPQYKRVYDKTISNSPITKFITICDSNGKIGVRDRGQLVIPTKFDKISLSEFTAYHTRYSQFPYRLEAEDRYYDLTKSDKLPRIIFNTQVDSICYCWDVIEHLDIDNICSRMLLNNYLLCHNSYRAQELTKHLATLKKRKDITRIANKYLNKIIDNCRHTDSPRPSLRKAYVLFPFIENSIQTEQELLDGMKSYGPDCDFGIYEKSKIRIYAKDFKGLERDARISLHTEPNNENYANIALIEALYLNGKYDEAFLYLENHGDDICKYTVDVYDTYPTVRYVLVRDAIAYNLQEYKELGIIQDTISMNYQKLVKLLEKSYEKALYSEASKLYREDIYLCKNYKSGNKYKYFMYNGNPVSPCFERYAFDVAHKDCILDAPRSSIRGAIMLIIDNHEHKRHFINFEDSIPRMIPGSFDHAWRFSDGLAVVVSNDSIGVIRDSREIAKSS